MAFAVWLEKFERGESFDHVTARLAPIEALQKLLQNQTCREDLARPLESVLKRRDFCNCWRGVAPEGERPDARVNEKAHGLRARSDLWS